MREEVIMNIEALVSIFTIIDGKFKILLFRKKKDPYKGYWILPSDLLGKENTLEEVVEDCITTKVGLSNLEYDQVGAFSELDRNPSKRIVGIAFFSIVDSTTIELSGVETDEGMQWFDIDNLPKIGYDHQQIIKATVEELKNKINHSLALKKLFPSDFTLPEIQKIYEQILGVELDRRNFRKKFVKADLIEETGDKVTGMNGRPATLYRFREDIEDIMLF